MNHQIVCTRVYRNGGVVVEFRHDAESWVEFNRTARPGCALFVDGQLRDPGALMTHDEAQEKYKQAVNLLP